MKKNRETPKRSTIVKSISIPPKLYTWAEDHAKRDRRTFSSLVAALIEREMKDHLAAAA
jgi:hypothetical protein